MVYSDAINAIWLSVAIGLALWTPIMCFIVWVMRMPVYHPFFVYMIYHLLGFIIRPFLIASQGASPLWKRIGYVPYPEDVIKLMTISCTALLSVFVGMLLYTRRRSGVVPALPPTQFVVTRRETYFLCFGVLAAAGIYATYRSLAGAGLDTVLAYETQLDAAGGQQLVGISGYLTGMAEFLPILCVMLFFTKGMRRYSLALIVVYIAVRVYAGAQRLSFIVVLAAVFFGHLVNTRRRYPRALPVLGLLLCAVVFDVIGHDRYAFRRVHAGQAEPASILTSYLEDRGSQGLTSDIVEFDVATATTAVVDNFSGYSYGTQYLRLLVWPIPRQLWPNKPVYTSVIDLNNYGDFRYLTVSLYADSYMALGFISLVPMMVALGALMGWLYRIAITTTSPAKYAYFWVFLIYIKTVLRDGGVTVVNFWAFSMVAALAIIYAGRVKLAKSFFKHQTDNRVTLVKSRKGSR